MTPKPAPPADPLLDFALLQQSARSQPARNRRALLWLLGLLLLLVGSVVTLVLYLNTFEAEEEERRRAADAQWLEQSAQFHFRRLEDDLVVLARQVVLGAEGGQKGAVQGGLLWRAPGVVLSHGWLAAGQLSNPGTAPERWQQDWAAHPANAEALTTMQNITRGLRRAAYAGPMHERPEPEAVARADVVWLAVPFFERGQFAGNYLAAVAMDQATRHMVPAWFQQNHAVRLVAEEVDRDLALPPGTGAGRFRASMNLPGTDLFLEVDPLAAQPATVPRIFFLVALLFLLGMLISLFALRRDFLKRHQVQALLQAQVALRTAMENSVTIGLRAWDQSGTILYVNDAFCRMVGYSAAELLGQSAPLPYWPADQTDELHEVHHGLMSKGTQQNGVEVQFQHRDGHLLDVLIHEAPLNSARGKQLGWMSSVLDISERKRAQRMAALQHEKLEASGRLVAVGEVASTLAHELNQPLGALSSFANGLLNRLRGGNISLDEMEPVVARMARLAERAGGIIQHVNAFARRREISRQRLDLMAFLRRVLAGTVEPETAELTLVPHPEPIWIEADALLLEHLVNNLTGNALDWAPRGSGLPQVRVSVELAQGMAALVVADSGPGVSEDDRAHIFNAFVSNKEGGMGMGLAICRSIVEAHHGRIEVGQDAGLGGARFTVWLPLAQPLNHPFTDAASTPPATPLPEEPHAPRRHSHR